MDRPTAAATGRRLGWSYLLQSLVAVIGVQSLAEAAVLAQSVTGIGPAAELSGRVRLDLRSDRLVITVQPERTRRLTGADLEVVAWISAELDRLGHRIEPPAGSTAPQALEIAIDALDIPRIRGFWAAAFGYADDPADPGPTGGLVDPAGIGPSLWFQQMTEPRPQRNRVHFDVTVAPQEAEARVAGALAAGGRLVSDARARAFWILADAEGNEVCVCTWQDRD